MEEEESQPTDTKNKKGKKGRGKGKVIFPPPKGRGHSPPPPPPPPARARDATSPGQGFVQPEALRGSSRGVDPPAEERKIIVDLLKEEKVAEATRYSEGLITAYPRSFMLFYSLGMSCLLLDEAEKARVYLKRATKLNPGVARFVF